MSRVCTKHYHAYGILVGQKLPSSLTRDSLAHCNALRVCNNASAVGRVWGVGGVVVLVVLQFS